MAALLLALLLTIMLDQGTATQHRIAQFGGGGAIDGARIGGLAFMVAINAIAAAALGAAMVALLTPDARLLFFAIALSMGGAGLLIASFRTPSPVASPLHSRFHMIAGLVLRRAGENAAFATAGVVAFTGAPILAAIGATLGGWVALVPPLTLGTRYTRHGLARIVQFVSGGLLLCIALACAVSALRIV